MRICISSLLICLAFAGCALQASPESLPPADATNQTLLAFAGQSAASAPPSGALPLTLPLKPKSVRFAVIGDNGTGDKPEFDVAREMEAYRQVVDFTFVIMLGDNIYGRHNPRDFAKKFEEPYKPLLDAGVKFYASLGNHDHPEERQYEPFHMGGERYYSFKKSDVTFFVLDSSYMNQEQLTWLEQQLRDASSDWKICYFHHPLYSDGKFHGPDLDLRSVLTPLFQKYGVNVVFSGHEHIYERLKPQNDIYYFVLGNSGQLRYHNLRRSQQMEVGFDTDRDFMLVEIDKDDLYFQTISRTGATIDSGVLARQSHSSNREQSQK